MRTVLLASIWSCLLAGGLHAAAPRCETKVQDGTTFEVCERADLACDSLAKEQLKGPSDKWNGCFWPATIMKSHSTIVGVVLFTTHVMIIASYMDSERVDMTITVEQPNHTYHKEVFKDVPIIIRNNLPTADITFATPNL